MNSFSSVQAILEAPAAIHWMGPRPPGGRRIASSWRQAFRAGALSSLLLVQGILALSPAHATGHPDAPAVQVLAQPGFPSGAQGAAAQWFNPLQHLPAASGLVLSNGTIDGFRAVLDWQHAGVRPDRIHLLVQLMLRTQSPVLTRSPKEIELARRLSERTAGMFELENDVQAQAFLQDNGMDALIDANLLTDAAVTNNLRLFHQPQNVTLADVERHWAASSMLSAASQPAAARANPEVQARAMDQASAHLAQAMDQAGLDTLVVPVSMWTDPQALEQAAAQLRQANAELSTLTGWTGGVLGLKGQVGLELGNANDVGLTQVDPAGQVRIQARFSDLAHEWIHALDMVVGRDLGRTDPDGSPILLSWDAPDQPLVAQWQGAYRALESTSRAQPDSWFRRLDALAQDFAGQHTAIADKSAAYFQSVHERMAYAFASHATQALPSSAILSRATEATTDQDARGPSPPEAAAQAPVWTELFTQLRQQWWAPAPNMPAVHFDGFQRLPYDQVAVEISRPGESLDDFVLRVAPVLDAFTAANQWEACGVLSQSPDGRYGLVVGSVQAALSCITDKTNVIEGFVPIGQTVHSHPRTPTVHPTASDQAIQARSHARGLPYREVERNPNATRFSDVDIRAGAGYLIAAGRVFHQQGWNTIREVGRLENPAKTRWFAKR